jgi:hypothetical protein
MFAALDRFGCAAIAVVTLVAMAPPARAQSDERFPLSARASAPGMHQPFVHQPPTPALSPYEPSLRLTVTPHSGQGAGGAPAMRSGAQMVCVRTCDGFFFPVSAGGSTDRAVAEFMCKASCPGAPVKLFTRRTDGEIEDAVGVDRSRYRKLAGALGFRKEVSPACSCRRPSGAITAGPVYDDPTLRAGDVIVVRGRALVFKGGTRPYDEHDFAPLEQSSLPAEARQKVAALVYFRSSIPASRTRKGAAPMVATTPALTDAKPRIVLPFPLQRETLPATATAFAPED